MMAEWSRKIDLIMVSGAVKLDLIIAEWSHKTLSDIMAEWNCKT